jgi:ribosome biogenesis ATPase
MDGLNDRKNVFIIAATNRPDIIDPAIMRPGRLDKLIYVDLPNEFERAEILKTVTKNSPLAPHVDLAMLAADSRCNFFSGADLTALVREAAMASLKEQLSTTSRTEQNPSTQITNEHFNIAFSKVFPSVSAKDRQAYAEIKRCFHTNQ